MGEGPQNEHRTNKNGLEESECTSTLESHETVRKPWVLVDGTLLARWDDRCSQPKASEWLDQPRALPVPFPNSTLTSHSDSPMTSMFMEPVSSFVVSPASIAVTNCRFQQKQGDLRLDAQELPVLAQCAEQSLSLPGHP